MANRVSDQDAAQGIALEAVLKDPTRINVEHAFSLHNMVEVEGGVRLHIVLKFKYDAEHIEPVFGATKPEQDVQKLYGEAHRLFPYCIFNSIDEVPLSWTYQNNAGRVYERIEMLVTLTDVKYMRHYPFELRLLSIKVGSDGTAKTGRVNLLPEVKKGTQEPNVDFGVFKKKTSALQISADAVEKGDVICRMVMRDLQGDSLGNLNGLYTRVYTVFFFETPYWENLFKYIILSTLLLHTAMFLPGEPPSTIVSTVLSIVLTEVALLFVMPETGDFTTAESVVVFHSMYMLILGYTIAAATMLSGSSEAPVTPMTIVGVNVGITAVTLVYVMQQYAQFKKLVKTIKAKFQSSHPLVGTYGQIDEQI